MAPPLSSLTLLLLLVLSLSYGTPCVTAPNPNTPPDLVRSSCVNASYPGICLRTLSSYAGPANTPVDIAQASVSVSINRAQKVSDYLTRHPNLRKGMKGQRVALKDCLEQLSDSVDQLRQTLSELQHLRSGTFQWHVSNAETWVSAALTNEDTCLDGFGEVGGKVKQEVKRKILNVAKVTSNALYLITLLDRTRGVPIRRTQDEE